MTELVEKSINRIGDLSVLNARFSIGRKLAATAAVLLVPLFLIAYLYVGELNKRVAENRQEMTRLEGVGTIDKALGELVRASSNTAALSANDRSTDVLMSAAEYLDADQEQNWRHAVQALQGREALDPDKRVAALERLIEMRISLAKELRAPSFFSQDISNVQLSIYSLGVALDKALLTKEGTEASSLIERAEALFVQTDQSFEQLRKFRGFASEDSRIDSIQKSVSESFEYYQVVKKGLMRRVEAERRLAFLGLLGQSAEQRSVELLKAPSLSLSTLVSSLATPSVNVVEVLAEEGEERRMAIFKVRTWIIGLASLAALATGLLGYFILKSIRLSQESLETYNKLLEKKVEAGVARANASRAKTEELNVDLKAQTERANEMAQKAIHAERVKGEFLANMSHEIRTPMNGVIGMTHLLLDTDLNETQRDYLRTMMASTDSLLVLINDILDLSKIEAGKMEIEAVDCDIVELESQLMALFASNARDNQIELVSMYPLGCDRKFVTDPHRIRQVLTNLLSNAVKFTKEGEVSLEIREEQLSKKRSRVHFSVTDSGIGISPEAIDTLFNAFSQADASTTRRFGGTGLGLAISHRLVAMMGGCLEVESQLGKGTTFSFSLELQVSQDAPRVSLKADHPGVVHKRSLLCMEPSTMCSELERTIRHFGAECELIEDASLVLGSARNGNFDTLILDSRLFTASSLGRILGRLDAINIGILHDSSDKEAVTLVKANAHVRPIPIPICPDLVIAAFCGQDKETTAPVVSAKPVEGTGNLGEFKVLLVDDNPTNRLVASKLLAKFGIEADVREDGSEAVEVCRENRYDLILMDCMMPEMDGYEATRNIRSGACGSLNETTPIVALTANAMEGDKEKCLKAGMSDYLAKPLRPEQLRATIDKWLVGSEVTVDSPNESSSACEESGETLLDLSQLEEAFGEDADELKPLIDVFIEGLTENLDAILQNESEGLDFVKLRLQSHTIKGSSANFGAQPLQRLAKEVELACVEERFDDATATLPELKELARKTMDSAGKLFV